MQTVLIVINLFVAIALTIVVLLQKSEGGALGMGGSGGGLGGFFSPRGAANTLTRTTALLGLVFFLSSLGLTWLSLHEHRSSGSILDNGAPAGQAPAGQLPLPRLPSRAPAPAQGQVPAPATTPAPAAPAPAPQQPAVPPSH